ncbi:hypothetical protein PIB30_105479, partial [Stylosanthes scabra]|nr:hypothetical protein [Stylosanthes scabra]
AEWRILWDSQWVLVVCSRIEVVYAWTFPMWAAKREWRVPRICVGDRDIDCGMG